MKRNRLKRLVGAVVLSAATAFGTLVAAPAAFAAGWYCGPVAGQITAINANGAKAAVTFQGAAHVFYQETGSWDLKHAWRTGTGWSVETLDGNNSVGGRTTHAVGAGVSAVVSGTQLVVTYDDGTNGDLRRAVYDGAWRYDVPYHAPSASTAAGPTAVVSPGVFHTEGLGYGGYSKLVFRVTSNSGWAEYFVDTAVDTRASITTAFVNGTLHVWYGKLDNRGGTVLGHAWSVEGHETFGVLNRNAWVYDTWRTQVLDGNGGTRGRILSDDLGTGGVSVATAGANHEYPHVFYTDVARQMLRHAWWNGAEWTFETLDGDYASSDGRTSGYTGFAPAAVNLNGVLHVFYSNLATGLRHAWFPGVHWGYEPLDGSGAATGHCTGSTTEPVFGPTAATAVGNQLYVVSSKSLSYPLLRVAEYR